MTGEFSVLCACVASHGWGTAMKGDQGLGVIWELTISPRFLGSQGILGIFLGFYCN